MSLKRVLPLGLALNGTVLAEYEQGPAFNSQHHQKKPHTHAKKKKKLACKVVRVSPSKALRMELGFLLPQAKQIKMLFVPEQMKSQSVGVMAIHGT